MSTHATPIDFVLKRYPAGATFPRDRLLEARRVCEHIGDPAQRHRYLGYLDVLDTAATQDTVIFHMPTYSFLRKPAFAPFVKYRQDRVEAMVSALLNRTWTFFEPKKRGPRIIGGYRFIDAIKDFPEARSIAMHNLYFVQTLEPTNVPDSWNVRQQWHIGVRKPKLV